MKIFLLKNKNGQIVEKAADIMSESSPWIKLGIKRKDCIKTIKSKRYDFYYACENRELAGFVLLENFGSFKGYIKILCVSEDFRGKGIGKSLIKKAEQIIFSHSKNVFLCVSSFNKKAFIFYKKLGYKRVGILKDFLVKGRDEYLMRKTKGPILKN
ncbi:MAG: GNAT family N-acetyltransferase [Elusimicrobia bacterium]|nr:GNAT family N-acetyltransferase [Elusimicrobiota bacterium]